IPPPRSGPPAGSTARSLPPADIAVEPSPSRIPSIPWTPASVASDAYALQTQLDELAQQFEQMKSQLRQAQKLASIGTTAAMIAHEFNNLLTPVVAYAKHALDL